MPPSLIPTLTAQAASRICMEQCRAGCCRGPLILRLGHDEVAAFQAQATLLGVGAKIAPAPDGGGWVRFADHAGECCPMLDRATSACRIYQDRPQRCRQFPERPTPGCAISGG
jgi:Fe-S-cluster containining protein